MFFPFLLTQKQVEETDIVSAMMMMSWFPKHKTQKRVQMKHRCDVLDFEKKNEKIVSLVLLPSVGPSEKNDFSFVCVCSCVVVVVDSN